MERIAPPDVPMVTGALNAAKTFGTLVQNDPDTLAAGQLIYEVLSISFVVLGGFLGGCAALLRRLLLEQGLAVRDRDLVIVGMNFSKGQEAVPVATVIHEGRLK